jgi:hypothetical protein
LNRFTRNRITRDANETPAEESTPKKKELNTGILGGLMGVDETINSNLT